jgi:subtilase family serine protease
MKVVGVLCVLFAVASARVFTVFDSVEKAPEGWSHVGRRTEGDMDKIEFTVALNTRNIPALERELMEISHPKNARYGQWWPVEKIRNFVAPEMTSQLVVKTWLESHGMKVQTFGSFQKVVGTYTAVENMLSTTFLNFRHVSGKEVSRIIEYTIPSFLDGTVLMISGLSGFPVQRRGPRVATDDTKGKVVPEVIWDLYGIPHSPEVYYYNSSICLVEFEGARSYTVSDLTLFEAGSLLPNLLPDHTVGPYYSKYPNAEATLDVQYGIGIAVNTSVWYWTTTGWLYDWTTEFLATDPAPYVVSMSWGWTEVGQCDIGACNGMTSEQYTLTVNDQFMQITMRGTTLLASSGDQGAPGDGNYKCNNFQTPLSSIFPGASPWVLSIGATALTDPDPTDPNNFQSPFCQTTDCSTSKTEIVCSYPDALITTGGGFSTYLARPSYQDDVVSKYLSTSSLPPSSDFNSTNRGFPDVSALGHNYLITYYGLNTIVDGTSASSPVWAGIVTRWNAYRLSKGLSSIGFANPMIYQMYSDMVRN